MHEYHSIRTTPRPTHSSIVRWEIQTALQSMVLEAPFGFPKTAKTGGQKKMDRKSDENKFYKPHAYKKTESTHGFGLKEMKKEQIRSDILVLLKIQSVNWKDSR